MGFWGRLSHRTVVILFVEKTGLFVVSSDQGPPVAWVI